VVQLGEHGNGNVHLLIEPTENRYQPVNRKAVELDFADTGKIRTRNACGFARSARSQLASI
jgi:hypothetical protein